MDTTSSFVSKSVNSSENLNWVFMTDWIIALLASLTILFYFNRAVAFVASFMFRIVIWKSYKVRIKLQSFKISYLGGRIFFKNLIIITENEMIMIHQGWFTWRYWLQQTRRSGLAIDGVSELDPRKNEKLPSRFLLEAYGLEVFMYNRTYAYDNIIEILSKYDNNKSNDKEMNQFLRKRRPVSKTSSTSSDSNDISLNTEGPESEVSQSLPGFLGMLPIYCIIKKSALIIGNETTTSLFIASCTQLEGVIDAHSTPSPLDLYRTVFSMNSQSLQVYLKPNVLYKGPESLSEEITKRHPNRIGFFKKFLKFPKRYASKMLRSQSGGTVETHSDTESGGFSEDEYWFGLERYLTSTSSKYNTAIQNDMEARHDLVEVEKVEYARYTHILDTDETSINYYWDVPGLTPSLYSQPHFLTGTPDIGNGGEPPKTGIDFTLTGAKIHYGPWTDRERGSLQSMLFPSASRDSIPFPKLKPHSLRQYVGFDLSIETVDTAILKIPFREASKDELFLRSLPPSGHRTFGWLELKFESGSTLSTFNSYTPTEQNGWDSNLVLKLQSLELSSSVNHDLLFRAFSHTVTADIGYPLEWNGKTNWTFNQTSVNGELFLLREHVTLLSDMFGDFSSGEPVPYEFFRPFIYSINWEIQNYGIYLNLNEKNIVNNPLDLNDNTFLTMKGSSLKLDVEIPLDTVYRKSATFDYKLVTDKLELSLNTPPWNTLHSFMKIREIGVANNFVLSGSYTYFDAVEIDSVDTIIINCTCEDTSLKCYGFVVRYVMILKANYFGEDINFHTLPEFMELFNSNEEDDHNSNENKPPQVKQLNETDLLFTFCIKNASLVLPSHLYDSESYLALQSDSLDIDIRFNNYYMDLQANFAEVKTKMVEDCDESFFFNTMFDDTDFKSHMLIDGLAVHGHRMFGLPPDEPTYFVRWEFDAGDIIIDSEPKFLDNLLNTVSAIGVGYDDVENSLGIPEIIVHDVLNLSFLCPMISISLRQDDFYFNVALCSLAVRLSDQCTTNFNSRFNCKIDSITASATSKGEKVLDVKTSLYFTDFVQKNGGYQKRQDQLHHFHVNDAPFHRGPFLLPESKRDRKYYKQFKSIVPSIPLPDVTEPLTSDTADPLIKSFPTGVKEQLGLASDASEIIETDIVPNKLPHLIVNDLIPTCEYDNLILHLGSLDIFFSPHFAPALASLVESMNNCSIDNVLDALQKDVLKFLLKVKKSTIINLKIECPLITLKISDKPDSKELVDVEILDVSFALRNEEIIDSHDSVSLLLKATQLDVEVLKEHKHAALLIFYCLDIALNQEQDVAVNFNQRDLSIFIDPQAMTWISEFVEALTAPIKESLETFQRSSSNKEKEKIEALYVISTSGVAFGVRHDPSCITKPSYVTRFTNNHVRVQNSWKILTRLRHVVKSLPSDWKSQNNQMFEAGDWRAPEDAEQKVFEVFVNWRRWEFERIGDSYILRSVFGLENTDKEPPSLDLEFNLRNVGLDIRPFRNLVLVKDVSFSIKTNLLDEVLRAKAQALSNEEVRDGIDIGVRVGSFDVNIKDMGNSIIDVVNIVKSLKLLVEKESGFDTSPSDLISESQNSVSVSASPPLICLNVSVSEYNGFLRIGESCITALGKSTVLSFMGVPFKDLFPFVLTISNDSVESKTVVGRHTLVYFTTTDNNITITNSGSLVQGDKFVDITASHGTLTGVQGTNSLLYCIDKLVNHDYVLLKPVFDVLEDLSASKKMPEGKSSSLSPGRLFDLVPGRIFSSFKCTKFETSFEVISPLLSTGEIHNYFSECRISKSGVILGLGCSRVNSTIISNGKTLNMKFGFTSIDKSQLYLFASPSGDICNVFTKLHCENVRFNLSDHDMIKLIEVGYVDYLKVENSIERLMKKIREVSKTLQLHTDFVPASSQREGVKEESDIADFIRYHLQLTIGVMGVIFTINDDQVVLDSSKLAFDLHSFDKKLNVNKPYGTVELPSTKLTFALNGPHSNKFTMFDMHFKLDMINAEDNNDEVRRFNLASNFCRFVLNPHFTKELIEFYFQVAKSISSLGSSLFASRSTQKNIDLSNPSIAADSDTMFNLFSIRIVSKNFCVGWLFPKKDHDYRAQPYLLPGLILGYESAEILSSNNAAKVLMTGMYISGAHSDNPLSFYSSKTESAASNRIFFPRFEMIYYRSNQEGGHGHTVKVNGDTLDFKLETNLFLISEPLWNSIASVQDKWDTVSPYLNEMKTPSTTENTVEDFVDNIPDDVKSIGFLFKFNGASFIVSNPNLKINGEIPSLCLQSPSLQVAVQYLKAGSGIKKHSLSIEALTSKTDNNVSSASVPIIHELIKGIKHLMKDTQTVQKRSNSISIVHRGPTERSAEIKLDRVFEKVKLNVSLKVEPQRLSMSCEPRANIEAAVSTKGIYLNFGTDNDFLSCLIYVQDLRAELQHVYSKEITGSLYVENMILNGSLASATGPKELAITGRVSNIGAYINMQQRQDLDLFVDIWLPNEIYQDLQFTAKEAPQESKSLTSFIREVHTTTAFPWIFTILIAQVQAKVDFGASLGVLNVSFDKFWAISRKTMNWDQNLRLEFEKFSVESVGRLSGVFVMENIRTASAISWRQEHSVSGIPLVLLTAGFKSLQCKMSLDFHPFFIAYAKNAMVSLYNQRKKNQVDNLVGKATVELCSVYMTALAASNFVDLYTIVLRISQDVKISYSQVLRDAEIDRYGIFADVATTRSGEVLTPPASASVPDSSKLTNAFLDAIQKLRTNLDVEFGLFQILIFPSTLIDSQVISVRVGSSKAIFFQSVSDNLENGLQLQLNDVVVSLSTFKNKPTEAALNESTVESYVTFANTYYGGHLFVFPSLNINMDLWQAFNSNVVHYSYDLRFGGNVDLRWKLGSVYFIREMWYSHATTLKTRLTALRIFTANYDEYKFDENFEGNYKESLLETVDLEDKLKDVESDKNYTYVAITEPHIETPQLKDLGDATPPLEWFGLHRSKFPNLTHQFVIIGLQKMVKHAETRYAKVLK